MTNIVTRNGKGAPLTWSEADSNFTNLNTDKLEASALIPYETSAHASTTYLTIANASSTYLTPATADATYTIKTNNLSDLSNVATARSNLGVSATGTDTTYNVKSANLSDVVDVAIARTNLGLGTSATHPSTDFASSGTITSNGNTMSTNKLLGRSTAATGAIEEITLGTGLSLSAGSLNVITNGSVLGTAQATTSGTAIDFTSIPSWVKRITVIFAGVSTNGSSSLQLQLGSGTFSTSGYISSGGLYPTATGINSTTGILIEGVGAAASTRVGSMILNLVSGNTWVGSGTTGSNHAGIIANGAGSISLSGTLDRIRLTTVNGTDTFDAGSVNILYE